MEQQSHRQALTGVQRMIVKLGTSSCLAEEGRVRGEVILPLARDIAAVRERGVKVILVSSGAVGMGRRTPWGSRIDPRELSAKQALAALGQVELMNMWQGVFELLGVGVAQVLLTRQELSRRGRYLNARNTLTTLLAAGVLPVINENDSVATDEIRFGDNDILAALVGSLVEADLVVNLTRADGLLDRSGSEPVVVSEVEEVDDALYRMVDPELSAGGTGGMASKLHAAREAARYGAAMVIASSSHPNVLSEILEGRQVGTLFWPAKDPLRGKKRWLASSTLVAGSVAIDPGACRALMVKGSSLLSVGLVSVEGEFRRGDVVSVKDEQGHEIGRGLVDHSSTELRAGLAEVGASKIVIHRDNLFLRDKSVNLVNKS